MLQRVTLLILALFSYSALAAPRVVGVFIDAKTEAKLGEFPYDRQIYATALQTFAKMGADSVVLKFFIDLPKTPNGDKALVAAMVDIPTFLQAAIEDNENSHALAPRFGCPKVWEKASVTLRGKEGFIPLPMLQEKSAGVGFVNTSSEGFVTPALIGYRDSCFPSLLLPLLGRLFAQEVELQSGQFLRIGKRILPLTPKNDIRWTLPSKSPQYFSYIDVLEGRIDKKEIQGNMIVFGYEGAKAPVFETPKGKMGAHILFLNALAFLIGSL